jgi:hypothetical protein
MTYSVSNINQEQDIIGYLTNNGVFSKHQEQESLQDFLFKEFTLDELGLPPADELLAATLVIKSKVGLQGWITNGVESTNYKGFSLTYNPDFHDSDASIYHQTWGSKLLKQNFGRIKGLGNFSSIRNTYYDTYAFRKIPDIVKEHLGHLFSHFYCPLLRSRVAFSTLMEVPELYSGWHVDEPPTHMFRINIPLQTSEEHVLEINGSDEYGNSIIMTKHLEVGKAYIWNTRIPHRVTIKKPCSNELERIHLVLGFGTWIDYNADTDTFSKSQLHGLPLKTIVEEKMFLKRKIA